MLPEMPIPYSIEAEESVLGAILNHPAHMTPIAAFLKSEHFFIMRHQYIFEAMLAIHERREPIDYLLLKTELAARQRLEDIGGEAHLTKLIDATYYDAPVEVYARLVERAWIRRQLLGAADRIKLLALQEDMTAIEAMAAAEHEILSITSSETDNRQQPFSAHISDYFDKLERLMSNPNELLGIPTGFRDLDSLLLGLQRSDLVLIAARPGMGKTSFLVSVALAVARFKHRVGFITLEMGTEQIIQRMVSTETEINLQTLRTGKIHNGQWKKFVDATERIADFQIFIDDTAALTPAQIRHRVQRWQHEHGLDLLVVDYLQKMGSGGTFKAENRVQEVSYFARSLKDMAKEFNIPVLAAAQLSRAVEQRQDKRPVLSDLRDSGEIEQEADIVMFLYRDEMYNEATEHPNEAEIIVSKHRNGPTGNVRLYFDKASTKFHNSNPRMVNLRDFQPNGGYEHD